MSSHFAIWQVYYKPPDPQLWQGRQDVPQARWFQRIQLLNLLDGFDIPTLITSSHSADIAMPHFTDVSAVSVFAAKQYQNLSSENSLPVLSSATTLQAYALVGFACDEGVRRNLGRVGAAEGPRAFRQQLAKLACHLKPETIIYDVGDIVCKDGKLEEAQQALAALIADLHIAGIQPWVIGGGHEVAWAHWQGLHLAGFTKKLGIINFDAHFDLRPVDETGQGHSGTSFTQIAEQCQHDKVPFHYTCLGIQRLANTQALFEQASYLQSQYLLAEDLLIQSLPEQFSYLERTLSQCENWYVTICLDVFAQAVAPGVSAPQPLGLLPSHVLPLLKYLARSGRVIAWDIAELSPPHDQQDKTAKLAASLVGECLHAVG